MPLGRLLVAVLVFVAGVNIALSRSLHHEDQVATTALSASAQAPTLFQPRLDDSRASRSHPRKPMAGLKRIQIKKCWNGFVGTVYDKCPTKPTPPAPVQTHRQHSRFVPSGSAESWAHEYFSVRVANCESGGGPNDHHAYYDGDPHLRDGMYHGKWQMNSSFWSSYGGLKYASDAADATEAEQDAVAYRGYLARGWEPWSCASMV